MASAGVAVGLFVDLAAAVVSRPDQSFHGFPVAVSAGPEENFRPGGPVVCRHRIVSTAPGELFDGISPVCVGAVKIVIERRHAW